MLFRSVGEISLKHGSWDYWIAKLDSSFNILWQKYAGGSEDEIASVICETKEKNYYVAGYSNSSNGDAIGNHGYQDILVMKLSQNGDVIWSKCLGGTMNESKIRIVEPLNDDGCLIISESNSNDGDITGSSGFNRIWIVRLNSDGNILWQKPICNIEELNLNNILISDDGILLCCSSLVGGRDVAGNKGYFDFWVVKMNFEGNIVWQKSFGGSKQDYSCQIVKLTGGSYVISGFTTSTDGDVTSNHGGSEIWVLKLGDIAESIKSDKLSLTINSNNDTSYLITQIKKITFPGITDIDTADFNSENQFSIRNSPNPVSDYTTFKYSVSCPGDVTLLIYNFLGEIISRNYEGNKSPGKYSMLLDFKNLPSGIYYYRLLCGPETFTGEIVHKK